MLALGELSLAKDFHPQGLPFTAQGFSLLGTVREAIVRQNKDVIMETVHMVITAVQNDGALSPIAAKAFICPKCLQFLCGRNQIQTLQ